MIQQVIENLTEAWKMPRWRGALIVALVSDAVGFGLALLVPVQIGVDILTAVLLFSLLRFRWPLLPALAVEVIPGLQIFPAWTLVVAALAGAERRKATPTVPPAIQQP